MAEGLLGMPQGQQPQQTQGGLFGGAVQTPSNIRRSERNRLMGNAVQLAQSPSALMASGATQAGLGLGRALGLETEGDRTARIVQQVQQESVDKGLTTDSDPMGTLDFAQRRFQELGAPELATRVQQQAAQMAPDPVETEIRFVGGTPRAEALQERYPEVGQVEDGQEITLTLLDGKFRGVKAGDEPEEETAPSRIREYELALQRGLINSDTSLEEYNQMRAGGGRSSVTPTETQLKPYASVISSNEDLNERIKSFVENAPESTLLGLNIPFTGGRDQDAVDSVSLQAQQRAAEIRSDNAELTIEQALEQAIDELSQSRGEPAPESDTSASGASSATPENDPYAGRVNP